MMPGKRALISCWDKTGVVDFARGIADLGWEIVSTGGTANRLREAGIHVRTVEDVTGHPSLLEGRVKTLHPAVHAGILARRDRPSDVRELVACGYLPVDLVAVNLYPFESVARRGADMAEALENIDIGGVTLLRAAAKNWPSVIVLSDPGDYAGVLGELGRCGDVTQGFRRRLATRAFGITAHYDAHIADYLSPDHTLPPETALPIYRRRDLRYGENPHQDAALYDWNDGTAFRLGDCEQLCGPDLSYNNFLDMDAALGVVSDLEGIAACAVKHTNPCGVAVADDVRTALSRAYDGDPVSIYGGVVAVNAKVDEEFVGFIREKSLFLEVLVAPEYTGEALRLLQRRKKLRVLRLEPAAWSQAGRHRAVRSVRGGLLLGDADTATTPADAWEVVGKVEPDTAVIESASLAWMVCRHTKSNAITVARDGMLLGVGAGQMNRVASARLALEHAGDRARGAVLASDGFFPFPDVVEVAAEFGIALIVQPGGSMRDEQVIDAADAAGVAMMFTGRRHFKH